MDLRANTAVDVLIGPFVDSADGNTTEDGLTLSQADIKLSKNGQALAQKNDDTTAAFDDDGYYNCELDATDVNTEGQLVLIVHESGALPVRHEYNVLAEAAWDSLYAAKDTGYMDVNVKAISEDTTAADNLELQYDTTGLTGDTFPATQSQVGNIATGAGGLSALISAFAKVGAEPETNTFTATQEGDGTYHIVEDAAGNTDFYYQATVGAGGKATAFTWKGYVQSNGDSTSVWYWDWAGTAYKQIDTLTGSNGTTPAEEVFLVPIGATGTGADEGKVRLRFLSTTTTAIATDRLLCEFTQASQSVGYANGQIWVDSNSSNTNTASFVDGVADNPVGSWANALTVSSQTGLTDFHILNGSTITLTGNSDNFSLFGDNWTLALAGQSVDGAYFQGAHVSGVGVSANEVHYEGCDVATLSVQKGHFDFCSFSGTVTHTLAGDYNYHNCYSGVPGSGGPTFAKTAGQAITAQWRGWKGSMNLTGLEVGDTLTNGGVELGTIDLGSPAGAVVVEIRGIYKAIANIGSAAINLDGAINAADVVSAHAGPRGPGVYLNDAAANTNTVNGLDGTLFNPVSTIAAAKTIADSLSVDRIYLVNNSSITLIATMEDYEFVGIGEMMANTINLGSQDVDNSCFENVLISGAQGGTGRLHAKSCVLSGITSMEITAIDCLLAAGTLTLRNDCAFLGWSSAVAGAGTPILNIDSVADVNVYMRHGSGGIQINNAVATTVMSVETDGQLVIDATCTSLTVSVRGNCSITDSGTTTSLTQDAAINRTNINAECDAALADYDGPTNTEMEARTLVAASYFDASTDGVFLTAAGQQDIAQIAKGTAGVVYFVATDGNDGSDGLTPDTAKLTPKTVIEAASANDVVILGPGTFTIGANQITIPTGVHIRGQGINATTLSGSKASAVTVQLGTNSSVVHLTSENTNAQGGGMGSWASAFTNAYMSSVRVIGDIDGLIINSSVGACSLVAVDCVLEAKYDVVALTGSSAHVVTLIRPTILGKGPTGTGVNTTRGVFCTTGELDLVNPTIKAIDGGGQTHGVVVSGGTVTVLGGSIWTYDTGGLIFDLYRTSGTLIAVGVEYDRSKTFGTITEVSSAESAIVANDLDDLGADWLNDGRLDQLLDGRATPANVLTQVNAALDAAISELGVGIPTATPSLRTGMMLGYMALRDQFIVQTSSTDALEIYNDAGTLIAKKLISDDGSDYTEAKMTSG